MDNNIYVDVRPFVSDGPVKAFVEITFDLGDSNGELTIMGFKVIQSEGKNPWVAFPNNRYKDKNTDEYKNVEIIGTSKRLKNKITDMVLEKYQQSQ